MGKLVGWLLVIGAIIALAYFIIAATNPELANDIVNFFTQ